MNNAEASSLSTSLCIHKLPITICEDQLFVWVCLIMGVHKMLDDNELQRLMSCDSFKKEPLKRYLESEFF